MLLRGVQIHFYSSLNGISLSPFLCGFSAAKTEWVGVVCTSSPFPVSLATSKFSGSPQGHFAVSRLRRKLANTSQCIQQSLWLYCAEKCEVGLVLKIDTVLFLELSLETSLLGSIL